METSHLVCSAKQMTGFYLKRNTWLKWVNSDTCYNIDMKLGPKSRHNNKVLLKSKKIDSDYMRNIYDVTLDSPSLTGFGILRMSKSGTLI